MDRICECLGTTAFGQTVFSVSCCFPGSKLHFGFDVTEGEEGRLLAQPFRTLSSWEGQSF